MTDDVMIGWADATACLAAALKNGDEPSAELVTAIRGYLRANRAFLAELEELLDARPPLRVVR